MKRSGFWESVCHYAAALHLRSSLLVEITHARRKGFQLPRKIFSRIWREPHNQEEYIWLYRFLLPEEKVNLIDIGGNSGYWSAAFRHYFPGCSIHAFEPIPEMCDLYVRRYADDKQVVVYNVALGEVEEQKSINVAKGYGLTSFHTYSDSLADRNQNFEKSVSVKVDRLDYYIDKIKWLRGQITVIKVDVQGFESHVVKGGKEVFAKADLVIVECSFMNEFKSEHPSFGSIVELFRPMDLHPLQFGVYDRVRSAVAYERNVLFAKSKYFKRAWKVQI